MRAEVLLASLLPPGVRTAVAERIGAGPAPAVLPEEQSALVRAVPRRRDEFAWGRHCARRALAELGIEGAPIPMGPDRSPVWPAGVVGSISHCADLAAAAVARADAYRGLGIDVERAEPLARDEQVAVCTPRERKAIQALESRAAGLRTMLLFGAKEALHKCVAPVSGVTLDFQDVSLELDTEGRRFRVLPETDAGRALALLAEVEGRFELSERLVLSAAWLRA